MAAAAEFVEALLRAEGWSETDTTRVVLATSEAAANAVEHASGDELTVCCRVVDAVAVVSVVDGGPGPDPSALERATLPSDPLATSGRGLHILRQLSDAASVEDGKLELRFRPRS